MQINDLELFTTGNNDRFSTQTVQYNNTPIITIII